MDYLLPKKSTSPYVDFTAPITITEAAYYVAGKVVMFVLLGEKFKSAEILRQDDEQPEIQNTKSTYKNLQRINNVIDFPPTSAVKAKEKRIRFEHLFLVVSAGVWCQNIYLFNKENISKKEATFEQIQTLALKDINKLLALRTLVEDLKWNYVLYEPQIEQDILLDYEALLYRQGFTLVRQNTVWNAVSAVAGQIAGKKLLPAQEIYNICSAQSGFDDIKNEVMLFYSIKRA